MNMKLIAANTNDVSLSDEPDALERSFSLLDWLTRLAHRRQEIQPQTPAHKTEDDACPAFAAPLISDDWAAIANICGYAIDEFSDAGAGLPLTSPEIDFFRRNHRGIENHIGRDFRMAQFDLPSPLAELYGLYRQRARIDAEAALWVAQSTNSTRVASTMADLLAIGAFSCGLEYVSYLGITYSVPCAFDSSAEVDHANREAMRRLALPVDHPSHLLRLKPEELGVLAACIAERNALSPDDFLDKANLLSEARQDVTRLSVSQHFPTAVVERDLPLQMPWVERLVNAYVRLLPRWVMELPEIRAMLG